MKKAFRNWRAGAFHLNFPNGNHVSTTWAPYSYSDNYDSRFEDSVAEKYGGFEPSIESDTVEVMIDCGNDLLKRLQREFNDGYAQPFARLSIEEWLNIVKRVANEKK